MTEVRDRNRTLVQFKNAAIADAILERLPEMEETDRSRRSQVGEKAQTDLERYYFALQHALYSVELTEAEASLICDVCNGWWATKETIPFLWANVADAIQLEAMDKKWGVDGHSLVGRLKALDYWQTLAIADAVERFWCDVSVPTDERLKQVGLIRESLPGIANSNQPRGDRD